jgi:hypothetical protein
VRESFDRRVVPDAVLSLIRACQAIAPSALGGGAALSGAHLGHRLSHDVDLFLSEREDLRLLVRELPAIASASAVAIDVRDAGTFVRCRVVLPSVARETEMDLIHDAAPALAPHAAPLEGVVTQSLVDLRANKLTCLLSRSEPRDLVDVHFWRRRASRSKRISSSR